MDTVVLLQVVLVFVAAESRETQSNLTTAELDEMHLRSLNSSQYLVQFCNSYCDGNEKKSFKELDFSTTPLCLECKCDKDCGFYGDCCPDINGNIISEPNPPSCLYTGNDLDILSKIGFGIFMVTQCQGQEVKNDVFSPVSSESKNASYFNKDIAECNNVTDITPWSLQLECSSGDSSGDHDPTGLDIVDHIYDNDEDCQHIYAATRDTNPRPCDPMLTSTSRVSECNVTNVWGDFDEETSSACGQYHYPVTYQNVVYANVFCAICNGIVPGRTPLQSFGGIDLPPPITVITQFSRPRGDPLPPEMECSSNEWMDPVKEKCHQIHCAPGKRLEGGECIVDGDDVIGDEYTFNVLLKPDDNANDVITQWNKVLQMFMENFKRFMSKFRVTNYKFSIGFIDDVKAVELLNYEITRGALINCNFVVTKSTNRTEFENQIYAFVTGTWDLKFDGQNYNFTSVLSNIPIAKVKLKANYWAYPVTGECCISVADNFDLKKTNIGASSRVVEVTNELFCPYVKLSKGEYETEENGWMNLKSINTSISSSDFSFDNRKRARICVAVLDEVYNGSYVGRNNMNVPASVLAQQILSLVCVTLSILCLAFTLVTYFTFPALRSLPAKNNMMLMGNLFVAQVLFQFGIDKTENPTVCIIIGVCIHYSWLCVVFWMNVCSFHMLRVFGVGMLPQSKSKHGKTLLHYSLYSFGSSALVVVVSLSVNLIMSRGAETGYGGVVCYLATNKLVGFSFVLPLSIILTMNITFFGVTVRAISKIQNLKKHGMKDRHNVYVYVKLSSLTGVFWVVAVLAEVFHEEVLVYISIILNGSFGVLLFFCYTANMRVFQLWVGLFDRLRKKPLEDSHTGTISTSA